jgi:hypothetical protein
MKTFLVIVITVIVVVCVLIFIGANIQGSPANQQHTIPVLSGAAPAWANGWNEYYLYVPGDDHSTCTWTYNDNGTPSSISTQPDPQTRQHDFTYNSSTFNIQVNCLSDQGIKYVGQFSG